jgi:hypothetical protein
MEKTREARVLKIARFVGADRLEDLAEDYISSLEVFIQDVHAEIEKANCGADEYAAMIGIDRLTRLLNWMEEESPLYGGTRIRYPVGGF